MKKNLLFIGDAGVPSGFARATHETLACMTDDFNITVMGINYRGDPHPYPYEIFAAMPGGDWAGIGRLIWMCDYITKKHGALDVIVIQNDPWNIPMYLKHLSQFPEYANVPVVAAVAVDGLNCGGAGLNGLKLAVFWTQFGLDEARKGGYDGAATVIPLGVDQNVYKPLDRVESRLNLGLTSEFSESFIVGNVNRNQPRKRLDLTIRYFAEWVKSTNVEDAFLYLHVAPTGDTGVNVLELMKYYGVIDRLLLATPQTWYGESEEHMAWTYNAMNMLMSTTQGEGFGLTTLEAMACGVPCIVPRWAALADWGADAALFVECTSTAIGPPYVNVIGGVVDEEAFINALDDMYRTPSLRQEFSEAGLSRASEDRFRWSHIGAAFNNAVLEALKS